MNKKTFIILILPVLALVIGYLIKEVWASSNPHSWTDGLVGYWSFDGQYTTSTAGTRDVSNNGNWGTFNGGVKPVGGVVGQALSFDGTDDYVEIANSASLNITGAISIEAWVKPNFGTQNRGNAALTKMAPSTGGADSKFAFELGSGTSPVPIYFYIYDGDWQGTASVSTLQDNLWYHIVGVYDGSFIRMYINGIAEGTPQAQGNPLSSTQTIQIGSSQKESRWGKWIIDEVRIYSRALSAGEVKQHYDQTRRNLVINQSSGTPPVGWWKMDEPTGAQVRDYSVNGNNGTVSNGGYGATSTDGKIGKALSFDGSNDYVNLGGSSVLAPTTAITLEAWTYPTQIVTGRIIDKFASSDYQGWSLFQSGGGGIGYQLHTTVGHLKEWIFGSGMVANNWYHIVATYDGQNMKGYINGIFASSTAKTGTIDYTSTPNVNLGRAGAFDVQYYNGIIDDVRIYNYARTADQIANDYRAGAYRTIVGTSVPSNWWTDGLVGYWNFDGQNTTSTNGTRDTSGNNNWGTFSGGVKPTAGISGQALSFDGSDDYVSAGSGSSLNFTTQDFTIELWTNITDSAGTLIERGLAQTDGYSVMYDPYLHILTHQSGTYTYCRSATPVAQNIWQHWVVVKSSTGMKIYLNGKEDTPYTGGTCGSTNPITSTRSLTIGNGNSWGITAGTIDEVRIYSRALSADEIMQHYLQTRRNIKL